MAEEKIKQLLKQKKTRSNCEKERYYVFSLVLVQSRSEQADLSCKKWKCHTDKWWIHLVPNCLTKKKKNFVSHGVYNKYISLLSKHVARKLNTVCSIHNRSARQPLY